MNRGSLRTAFLLPLLVGAGGCSQLQMIRDDVASVDRKVDSARIESRDHTERIMASRATTGEVEDRTRADLLTRLRELAESQNQIQARLDMVLQRLAELDADQRSMAGNNGLPGASSADTAARTAETLFRTAMEDFQRGRYDLAYRGFQDVLAADTAGVLASRTLFQMGESRFLQRDWDEARSLYQRMVRQFPRDPLACAARFKIGLAHQRQGAIAQRDRAFEELQNACPGSNESQRATEIVSAAQ